MIRTLAAAFAAVFLLAAGHPPAAHAAEAGKGATKAQLERLVKTIQDESARKKLVEQLQALIAAQGAAETPEAQAAGLTSHFVDALAARARDAGEALGDAASLFRDGGKIPKWLADQAGSPEARSAWLRLILKLIAVAIAAVIAGWIVRRLLARPRAAVEGRAGEGIVVRLFLLVLRTALDFIPIAAAAATAYLVLPLTEPSETTRRVVVTLINAYVIVEVIMVLARMVLAPRVQGLRFLPTSGETANYLFIWVRRIAYVWVYAYYLTAAAGILGLPPAGQRFIITFLGLVIAAMAIVFVLQNRHGFADFIRGEDGNGGSGPFQSLRNRVADVWHALAVIYVAAVYVIWALRIEGGFENFLRASVVTVAAIVVTMLLGYGVKRGVKRGFSISDEVKARYPGLEARANRYLPVIDRVLRSALWLIAALVVIEAWGGDVISWLGTPRGGRFVSGAVSIVIVLVVALVAWEGASAAIERYLTRAAEDPMALARRDRARTLLPMLRNVIFFVIAVMVVLVVLAEIGVDIGPLLAGAGIAGLAVGFGAQKLVQDVITGAFMVFEDALAVGDVVTVAGASGRVEAMSIRSLRLRDVSGNVHNIPFSSVDQVVNMTKEFSYYVFDVGVAYRENVDEVIEVLKALGAEMQADPDWAPKIMEPLEVLGLNEFGDSAVIIRVRFKTLPIEQWAVGREFNRRIKNRFDELGIEIPFPHQTIYFGEDKEGKAPAAPVRIEDKKGG